MGSTSMCTFLSILAFGITDFPICEAEGGLWRPYEGLMWRKPYAMAQQGLIMMM